MTAVFPTLPGLTWNVGKYPEFSTKIQTSASGFETRIALWATPIWHFTLNYEMLRDDATNNELKQLMGFFLQRQGQFEPFNYTDPTDNTVTGQNIGAGDGSTKTFQLIRALGGFVEPIKAINGTPTIYIDGAAQGSGWTVSSTGLITFTAAPTAGAIITADFAYYFRVRFTMDKAEFERWAYNLWQLQTCELVSVKV